MLAWRVYAWLMYVCGRGSCAGGWVAYCHGVAEHTALEEEGYITRATATPCVPVVSPPPPRTHTHTQAHTHKHTHTYKYIDTHT